MDAVQAENKISKLANVLYTVPSSNVWHFYFLLNLRPSGLKVRQKHFRKVFSFSSAAQIRILVLKTCRE